MRLGVMSVVMATVLSIGFSAHAEHGDGVRVFEENPRYLSYDGEPIFLASKTFWNNAISDPDCDYERDLAIMAEHGGNLIRQAIFWPGHGESGGQLPWARDDETGIYDLDTFNPAYFEKLRTYLALAEEHKAVVNLELFCHPSVKGGSGRWPTHPMNPAKNINYGDDVFGTSSCDRDFYWTLPEHNDNPTALHYQEALVRKLLEETIDFRNVIYSLGNECPSPEEWNIHWSDFIKSVGKELGAERVYVTNMWRQDLPAFDVFDIQDAQNPYRVRRANASGMWEAYQALYAWQREHDRIKPVYDSGQMGGAPGSHILHQLWMSFVGGTAGMRYHRAAPVHPRPGVSTEVTVGDWEDPRYLEQQRWIRNLHDFIDGMEFWTMDPLWDAVIGEREGYAFGRPGNEYVFFLPVGGSITVDATGAEGRYDAYGYDPDTGERGESWILEIEGDQESFTFTAPLEKDYVFHLQAIE